MHKPKAWTWAFASCFLAAASGCQTWVPEAGLTLPSWRYLDHQPSYIAPSPEYPLTRELNSLEEAWKKQANPAGKLGVGGP